MDDGSDAQGRHVRGLVLASEVLSRPGLSARTRLARLCDITGATVDARRTAVHLTDDGGRFRCEHRAGPELDPATADAERGLLSQSGVVERLAARHAVVLAGGDRPPGRDVLVLTPIVLEGGLRGCLCVEAGTAWAGRVDEPTRMTLTGLANVAAHVLLAERMRTDRAEVLSRDLLAEQRNRRRISNRLHDGPQQILVSLRMRLQMLERDASDELAVELGRLARYVEAARDDLRALILDLDTMTGHTVLTNALRSLLETNASMASWQTTFEADDGVDDVSEETQLTVERVVQEALGNARQHAGASTVSVQVRRSDDVVTVVVADDGVGIPPQVPTTSTGHGGIRAMHERIWLVGGTVHIDRAPDRGTRVVVTAPRHP